MTTTIIKYFAEYKEKKNFAAINLLINTALASYIVFIPIIGLIVFIIILNIHNIFNIQTNMLNETKILFCIIGINFCIGAVGNIFASIIVGLRKFRLKNSVQVSFSIIRSLCIIVMLKIGYGLIIAAITVLCVDLLMNIAYAIAVMKSCPYLKITSKCIDFKSMTGIYNFTFYNFLRQISVRIIERSPVIIIGIMLDLKMVAFYSIAESLTNYLAKIPKGIRATILPFASKLNASDQHDKIKKMAFLMPKYTMSFFLGIIVVVALFGHQLFELWLGPGYDLSYKILIILLIVKAIVMSQSMLIHIVVGMGQNKFYGILGLFEMLLVVFSCIILAKPYGVFGISMGLLLSAIATNVIFIPVYSLKKIGQDMFSYYLHIFIISIILCSTLYFVNACYFEVEVIIWIPVVVIEFVILSYFLVWNEIKFKNGRLRIEI
jgi:O-antigen/teichoic acid export membrane protein